MQCKLGTDILFAVDALKERVELKSISNLVITHLTPKRMPSLKAFLQERAGQGNLSIHLSNPALQLLRSTLGERCRPLHQFVLSITAWQCGLTSCCHQHPSSACLVSTAAALGATLPCWSSQMHIEVHVLGAGHPPCKIGLYPAGDFCRHDLPYTSPAWTASWSMQARK